jgi:hypothetical protein
VTTNSDDVAACRQHLASRKSEGAEMTRVLTLRSISLIGTVVALTALVGAGTKWW